MKGAVAARAEAGLEKVAAAEMMGRFHKLNIVTINALFSLVSSL